ncbi:MAG: NAD-dependent epimerase/dehydratase family protein [Planctomycetota bacterium]
MLTGYGGFLGSEIARQLLDAGHQVRGVARGKYKELESLGVETIQGSVVDRELVLDVTQGCDAIINTAAKAGVWGKWDEYYSINTGATSHLLEAAHRHKVQSFVQTSSPSVTFAGEHQSGIDESAAYPDKWLCFYPHTKALAEQAVLDAAQQGVVRTCALRPHLIWGKDDPHLFPRVIQRTLAGRLRCVGDGKNWIDVVHVRNAARSHVLALEKLLQGDERVNGEAFFITDGRPVECWQWITRILETAGVDVPQRSISFSMAYKIGAVLEFLFWGLRRKDEPPMTRFVAAQLAQDHYFSIDKARDLLGYDPQVDLDEEFANCKTWLQGIAASCR